MNPGVVIVLNPQALADSNAPLWRRAADELRRRSDRCDTLETRGDGGNIERVSRFISDRRPQIVVAAGGDGTVSEVVQAIMVGSAPPPALAIMPLGTANDIARSFGLLAFRQHGETAVDRAVAALLDGRDHRMDLGLVSANGLTRHFVGNFTIGMDADILATRNRLQRRWQLGRGLGGYPLYLWSCAANVLARRHGGDVRLCVDGVDRIAHAYNLLVTNTPQYAGEFRFDGDNLPDDGHLDLHLFSGALDYLRRYPAAWRRHVHYARGEPVTPPRELERVREIAIELAAPVAAQLDGEEWNSAVSYVIRVVPQALMIRVPSPASHESRTGVTTS